MRVIVSVSCVLPPVRGGDIMLGIEQQDLGKAPPRKRPSKQLDLHIPASVEVAIKSLVDRFGIGNVVGLVNTGSREHERVTEWLNQPMVQRRIGAISWHSLDQVSRLSVREGWNTDHVLFVKVGTDDSDGVRDRVASLSLHHRVVQDTFARTATALVREGVSRFMRPHTGGQFAATA